MEGNTGMTEEVALYRDEAQVETWTRGVEMVLRRPFLSYLSVCLKRPAPYDCLTREMGQVVKQEKRTVIRLIETHQTGLFCKHYLYPGLSRFRTLGSMPKAQREYVTLGLLKVFGIPCVEAAGWGARKGPLREVCDCFVLTVRHDQTLDFRAWLKQMEGKEDFHQRVHTLLNLLAGYFRALHERRFFLLRPNTRNVLVLNPESHAPGALFLDQPYARFLRGPAAIWGQLKDLSTLLGGVQRHLSLEETFASFFEKYLPDPLGDSPNGLRGRVKYAIRARESGYRLGEWGNMARALAPALFGQKMKKKVR